MRYIFSASLVALLIAIAPSAQAQSFKFKAGLSGAQEVPSNVDTATTGQIKLRFNKFLSEAKFVLRIRDGVKITQAHLHCGAAGSNGPVVALLFNVAPLPGPGGVDVDGIAAKGILTNDDLSNPAVVCGGLNIGNIASLLAAIRDGNIYVNVHSEANPPGEIRGQIFDRFDHDSRRDDDDEDDD